MTTQGAAVVERAVAPAVPEAIGWMLALRAAERLPGVTHVRTTGFVAGPRRAWDRSTRQVVATAITQGAPALVDGRPVVERVAERRWLAWFPRPVGPRHAVNVGGRAVEVLAGLPGLRLVRSHLVVRSWQAEVLQAAAGMARTGTGREMLSSWVERGRVVPDDQVRWACVVEATVDDHELVRAWAHGWGPGATAAALVRRLGRDGVDAGSPRAPDLVGRIDPRPVLDDVTRDVRARWSMAEPVRR